MTNRKTQVQQTALTLALGAGGAGLFWLIGFPAAVLTGPAAVVSIATIFGLRTGVPDLVRDACFLTLGISIGSTVTPEVIATAISWPLSLLVLTLSLAASILVVRRILAAGFGFDRMTALLASTPGHLSYVLGLSTDIKADVPRVALVQSIRVLMLTLLVPVLIVLWGAEGTAPGLYAGQIGIVDLVLTYALSVLVGGAVPPLSRACAVLDRSNPGLGNRPWQRVNPGGAAILADDIGVCDHGLAHRYTV